MKKIAGFIVPLAALAIAAALPFPYISLGSLMDAMGRTLRVKIDPRYSGGEVLASFLDPMDDDRGEGALVYPAHPAFQGKNYLDIVKYVVHEPVTNWEGGDPPDYWQVDLTLTDVGNPLNAPLGFSHPVVHIYIDLDGKEGGSTQTAFPDAELVSFDPAHPWDYMIHIDGFAGDRKGYILSSDQAYKRPVEVYYVEDNKTIYSRLRLDDSGLKKILDGRPTYHYVVVGASDPLSAGGFMPVAESAGPRNGGGARSALTPRIYDWVEPKGAGQARHLSSYNPTTGGYAVLVPIEVKRGLKDAGSTDKADTAGLLATYKERFEREQSAAKTEDYQARLKALLDKKVGGMELAEAYYQAGQYDQAKEEAQRVLEASPGDAGAATCLAKATARLSGRAQSPMKAMELVQGAFSLFEKAQALCRTPDELLTVYLQRGRYAMAVPEGIFRKSAAAAADFLDAAAIIKKREASPELSSLLADCYINAARAFSQAGKADEAEIYFHKAAEFEDLTTAQIIALLERGIIPAAVKRIGQIP